MDPVTPAVQAVTERRRFLKINPATGEPIGEYEAANRNDILEAVQRGQAGLVTWRNVSLKKRAEVLASIRDALYHRADEAAALVSEETGKPLTDALEADVGGALGILSYYAEIGPGCLKPRLLSPDLISVITGRSHRETCLSRGIIGLITPWNYPLAIPASGLAAALMAGNVVILKPSEHAPAIGQWLAERCREVIVAHGLPPDVVQALCGDGSTGAALVEAPVDGLIFTGSANTGRHIRCFSEANARWCSLELGGSDAMLILPGCNLEKAASYALWGRFTNAGQACAATKRLLVPEKAEAELLRLLQEKISRLRIGPPDEPGNHIGPLISEAQLLLVESQVRDALERGARRLAGGQRRIGPGWFYEPTLLSAVPDDARILQEETFGPVLPVIPYRTLDEAIHRVNHSPFGLTAAVFGPETDARAIAPRLECATVVINDVGPGNYAMACAPWGGWKESGSGVSHGARALLELCRRQVLSVNHAFQLPFFDKPLWHFGRDTVASGDGRARATLAFCARRRDMWHPRTWLAFWQNRASTKI